MLVKFSKYTPLLDLPWSPGTKEREQYIDVYKRCPYTLTQAHPDILHFGFRRWGFSTAIFDLQTYQRE